MDISYDVFAAAFLAKITEFDFVSLPDFERTEIVDGYMKRAISAFNKICGYDFATTGDDDVRKFHVDVPDGELDEIIDVVSEGMVVQWLKPYLYRQELLENALNSRDFTTYSPAELLMRVGNAYEKAKRDYTQMIREYSYNHGNLSELHL